MNNISKEIPEKLYLSKGNNNEIYINNCQILHKTQISGIRYLFKVFKKRKLGVILNYPSGSGRSVLVALFIEAVVTLLTAPVLILCKHDNELQSWKQTFLDWTNFTDDDLALDSAYPLVKKKVSIKKALDLNAYLRRKWSVLILKNDEVPKEISKLKFDADYKIWITSVDVYHDLTMLSTGLNWIYPKVSINIKDFETENKSVKEVVQILTLLEVFCEDIVIRAGNVKSILEKTTDLNITTTSKVSKKNKDATGTKIKKSKRKICDNTADESTSSKNTRARINEVHSNTLDDTSEETSKKNTTSINIVYELNREDNEISDKYNEFDDEICLDDKNSPSIIGNFIHNLDKRPKSEQNIDYKNKIKSNIKINSETKEKLSNKDDPGSAIVLHHTHNEELHNSNNRSDIVNTVSSRSSSNDTQSFIKSNVKDEDENKEKSPIEVDNVDIKDNDTKPDVYEIKNNLKNELVFNETKTNVTNISVLNDTLNTSIDDKLSALEERTLKKYKGSILDSIF